ncbi:putative phosphatidylcholine--sterol O-acyltransferase [Rosa chinensis]|uniref:Putative phosphatidylcholine--sterol O-acyltransferase n=1 Tax=Rosa chinensis TaxID=74649 RepID=A0A2P6Q133_ROSCH|nr:lecithin-cholesterol acyltransferase-like 1 [Rosa chinensis]PRQ27866.1 putative phosphatidylcholine--sterol O-acyltransferase [Rosa chinensis]
MKKQLGLLVSMAVMMYTCQAVSNLHPVILIPGNGGNQLEARLTPDYKPSSLVCNRWYPIKRNKEGWFRLWFDPTVLLAPFTTCFAQRMTLYYDQDKDDYHNAPGVETRVPHFGSIQSLLFLDPNLKKITTYMAPLVESLENIGYVDGKTMFGAPYDFRYGLAPKDHPSRVGSKFLKDLKDLVEKAGNSNGGKPVILVSHSLGGLFALQLLNRNKPSWRQKFIKHVVALSAPWGGTVDEMLTFASGNTLGVPLVNPLLVREEQRSSESNLWLMPNPRLFRRKKPIVITPDATYSAHNIPQFLNDIGFPEGIHPFKTRILVLMDQLEAPGVPLTCVIGTGVRTAETLFYDKRGFDEQPEIVYGDGDGTVNMLSLLGHESLWSNAENQTLKTIRVPGVTHTEILKDDGALGEVVREISGINSQFMFVENVNVQ